MSLTQKIKTLLATGSLSTLALGCVEENYHRIQYNQATIPSSPTPTAQPSNPTPTAQPTNPTVTAQPFNPTSNALFAQFLETNPNGSVVLARDLRRQSYGKIISIDTQQGTTTNIDVSTNPYIDAVLSSELLIEKKYNQSPNWQQDLAFYDLATGVTLFATQSPGADEWLVGNIGNTTIFNVRDYSGSISNGAKKISRTQGPSPLLPNASDSYAYLNKEGLYVIDRSSFYQSLYELDRSGVPQLIFDLQNANPVGGSIDERSSKDLVIYNSQFGDIVYQPINITGASQVIVPLQGAGWSWSSSVDDIAPGKKRMLLRKNNNGNDEFVDIDLSRQPGYISIPTPQGFASYESVIGDSASIFKDQSNNSILIYDRQNGLRDTLTPQLPTNTAQTSLYLFRGNGTGVILFEGDDLTTSEPRSKLYYFDGQNILPVSNAYSRINYYYLPFSSLDHLAVECADIDFQNYGISKRDIISIDMKTGQTEITPTNPNDYFSGMFNNKQGDILYNLESNNQSTLYLKRQGQLPQIIDTSQSWMSLQSMSEDGSSFFYTAHSGPRELIKYDLHNKTWTVIANE